MITGDGDIDRRMNNGADENRGIAEPEITNPEGTAPL
jgi:hypothetical protein